MYDVTARNELAVELARAFPAGSWEADQLAERGAGCLDRWPSWMSALALHVVAAYRSPPAVGHRGLAGVIDDFLARRPLPVSDPQPPGILRRQPARPPVVRLRHDWPIAQIESVAGLAQQLELSVGQLAWLADARSLERTVTAERLRNYRYAAVPRRGGVPRVIEAPKARLKEIQRWVLRAVLDRTPAHDAAHGFVVGRSVVSHAGRHAGQPVVVRLDLADFFASIPAGRIFAIFHTLGYSAAVAHALTGLCSNTVPLSVWAQIASPPSAALVQRQFWLGRQLATPHLPQGAPTSPALANLAAFRLDRRLTGLAASLGLRYSRYADDLTFSGVLRPRGQGTPLRGLVARIARAEGFAVNPEKSSLRTAGARQSVCGVVVNAHPNVTRAEYDRLKAILHNAARHGPRADGPVELADLRGRLRGQIAWVASVNPARGETLRRRFAEIDWGSAAGSR